MEREILEQPSAWRSLLRDHAAVTTVVEKIREWKPEFVLFIARGTSDNAALYGKYLAEVLCGYPSGSWSPSTTTLYGAAPRLRHCLVIAVSQSGGSPDLVRSLASARDSGALTLSITNSDSSPLVNEAELTLNIRAGEELAVAATKSYTAELIAMSMLFTSLAREPLDDFGSLPDWGESMLRSSRVYAAIDHAAHLFSGDRFVLTGRGYASATAHEGALKLMETCYVSASGFSGADLIHGPLAMIDSAVAGVVLASPGLGQHAIQPVLERLRATDAPLLLIGPKHGDPGEIAIALPPSVPDHLAPILEILPLQLLALTIARHRGIDPDRPRGLLKVTETT